MEGSSITTPKLLKVQGSKSTTYNRNESINENTA